MFLGYIIIVIKVIKVKVKILKCINTKYYFYNPFVDILWYYLTYFSLFNYMYETFPMEN